MKQRLTIIITLCLSASFWSCRQQPPALLPPPTDGTIIHFGEEGQESAKREAWLELMHQAAPGTDWRNLEYQTRMQRHEERSRQAFFRSGCTQEVLAEGRLAGYWQERGSANQAGSVLETAYDLAADEIWLISAGGALWRGDRLGSNWEVANQDLQFNRGLLQFIPRANGRRLLAFAGRLPHYSDDDGQSWTKGTGIAHGDRWGNIHTPVVICDGENYPVFVLAKPDYWADIRLYQSLDQGGSYLPRSAFNTSDFSRLALAVPHHFHTVFLAEKAQNGQARIYEVDAATGQLEEISGGSSLNFGNARANLAGMMVEGQLHLYAYTSPGAGSWKIYRSLDGGRQWQLQGALPAAPWEEAGLYVSPSDPAALYIGEVECYRSLDAGQHWEKVNNWWDYYEDIGGSLHADIMDIKEFETAQGQPFLLVSNHGGLSISMDRLESTANIGLSGLNVSQYYSVRTDPLNPAFVYAGSQDQGLQRSGEFSGEGPASFEQVISGDYGQLAFSRGGAGLWAAYPGGWITYYGHPQWGGYTAAFELESENETVWLPPLIGSPYPDDPAAYLAGGSINGGQGSYLIRLEYANNHIQASQGAFNFLAESAGGTLSAMATAPQNPDKWYAATTNGRFFYSADGGQAWSQSLNFLPEGHYLYGQAIYPFQSNGQTVVLAGSGYSNPAVYRSADGGRNFQPMSDGLPATLVFDIAGNEDESLLFAATEAGPYVYIAEQERWHGLSGQCAPAQAYWSVEYLPGERIARFGTYGRGIWDFKIEIVSSATAAPAALSTRIYPNPAGSRLNLALPQGIWSVQLLDNNGKIAWQKNKCAGQEELQVRELPRGLYYLRISDGTRATIERVILQ
ncbi:MAG: T9SS type A sorting domain-containing protein [Lewinellaceae bacterium]|nr:T9SS type A sorting domain-containing protein [Phaeodactylibacter sp.]MCB9039612.1 T9SS type A sorting domain-containing protein [Lewinellaceae bacterium]